LASNRASGKEGVRENGIASAAAEAFLFSGEVRQATIRSPRFRSFVTRRVQADISWFQALMHFSAYLMIAALLLLGLQLAYAFYQLATFVL
jgi:hypothetical protein